MPVLISENCECCGLPFDGVSYMTEHGFEVCSDRCGEKIEARAADKAVEPA